MDVVSPSETQVETGALSADDQASPNSGDLQPPGADNNVSQVRKPPASGPSNTVQDSLSAEEMLKLMEKSDKEAAMAVTKQKTITSSDSLPTEPIIDRPVNDLRGQALSDSPEQLVALLVPLTGRGASLGEAMLNAAQMALFDTFDEKSRLIIRDTKGTPEGAEQAVRFVLGEGVRIIIGPLFNTSVRAVAPVARSTGVPMVVFSNDKSVAGDGVYVFGFTPEQEVVRILGYAADRGISCEVALVPSNDYGRAISTAFMLSVAKDGLAKTVKTFLPDGSNITDVVKELAAQHVGDGFVGSFDCLLIASGGDQLRAIATRLPYYDIDMSKLQLLGTALWQSDLIGREPSLRGGWFAGPIRGTFEKFSSNYASNFGSLPPARAALAYDAVSLVGKILQETPSIYGSEKLGELLTRDAGFKGIQGLFSFSQDGVVDRSLAVYEVTRRGFKLIDSTEREFSD